MALELHCNPEQNPFRPGSISNIHCVSHFSTAGQYGTPIRDTLATGVGHIPADATESLWDARAHVQFSFRYQVSGEVDRERGDGY